jgi:hypothetical protein
LISKGVVDAVPLKLARWVLGRRLCQSFWPGEARVELGCGVGGGVGVDRCVDVVVVVGGGSVAVVGGLQRERAVRRVMSGSG